MRKARTLLPTDLLALVAYNGRIYPNEAKTRERIGSAEAATYPLETALERWLSFVTGRNAWISARGHRLQGLVSTRRRGGRQAWEIDCLIDTTRGFEAVPGLLECATTEAGRSGAQKLFLRLAATSELLPAVRAAGFSPFQYEALLIRETPLSGDAPRALRPFSLQDEYPAYLLYNSVVPEIVRRSEAATFSEWHASQERQWLKNGVQLVKEANGRLTSWVQAAKLPQGTALNLLVGSADLDNLEGLMAQAAETLGAGPPFLILVRHCSEGLARQLEDVGFEHLDDYISLVHRTTLPLRMPKMVPVIGKNVVTA